MEDWVLGGWERGAGGRAGRTGPDSRVERIRAGSASGVARGGQVCGAGLWRSRRPGRALIMSQSSRDLPLPEDRGGERWAGLWGRVVEVEGIWAGDGYEPEQSRPAPTRGLRG